MPLVRFLASSFRDTLKSVFAVNKRVRLRNTFASTYACTLHRINHQAHMSFYRCANFVAECRSHLRFDIFLIKLLCTPPNKLSYRLMAEHITSTFPKIAHTLHRCLHFLMMRPASCFDIVLLRGFPRSNFVIKGILELTPR